MMFNEGRRREKKNTERARPDRSTAREVQIDAGKENVFKVWSDRRESFLWILLAKDVYKRPTGNQLRRQHLVLLVDVLKFRLGD